MKKLFSIITLAFGLLVLAGCNDLLEVPPVRDIPEEKVFLRTQDIETVLLGSYDKMQSMYGTVFQFSEALSDNVTLNHFQNDASVRAYNWQLGLLAGNIWNLAYQAINNANKVIEVIHSGTITDADFEVNKARQLAEAHFIRALMHFELVRLYAPQYDNNAANNRGIIIKTLPTSGRDLYTSSSVKRVYDQIKYDLKIAMGEIVDTTLPENKRIKAELPINESVFPVPLSTYVNSNGGRPFLFAARYLYAKVCFQQGTKEAYDEAKTYIDKVILPTPFPNFAEYLEEDIRVPFDEYGLGSKSKEIVFQLINELGDNSAQTFHSMYYASWEKPGPVFKSSINGDTTASLLSENIGLYNLFTLVINKSDKRSMYQPYWWTNLGLGANGGYFSQKWRPAKNNTSFLQNIPIMRHAEFILMRAEIKAIKGDLEGAAADIEEMRAYRYTSDAVGNAQHIIPQSYRTDMVKLVKLIRAERRIEMAFEGNRIHDIRRCWNDVAIIGTPPPIVAPVDRTTLSARNWDDITLLYEFPDAEVIANPNVENCCDCGGNPGNCKPQ